MARLSVRRKPDNGQMQRHMDRIRPLRVKFFFDRIDLLSMIKMSPVQKATLDRLCGSEVVTLDQGHWYGRQGKRWQLNIGRYLQKWIIRQPSAEALEFLARLGDNLHLNYVEPAINLIFSNQQQVKDAAEFFVLYNIMLHRRDHRVSNYVGRGHARYSSRRTTDHYGEAKAAARRVRIIFVTYWDRMCAWTGARHCVHHECRLTKAETLRRIGIHCVDDLLDFDHAGFWRDRLLFADIDDRTLGMAIRRQINGDHEGDDTTIGAATRAKYATNDGRTFVKNGYDPIPLFRKALSTQNLVDELRIRHGARLDDELTYAAVDHLLPAGPCVLRPLHSFSSPTIGPVPGGRVKRTVTPPARSRMTPPRSTPPSRSPPPTTMQTSSHQQRKTTMITSDTHMEWDIPPNTSSLVRKRVVKKRVKTTVTPRQRFQRVKTAHSLRPIEYSVGRWGTDNEDRYHPADHSDADVRRDDRRDDVPSNDRAGRIREDDRDPSPRPGRQVRKRK